MPRRRNPTQARMRAAAVIVIGYLAVSCIPASPPPAAARLRRTSSTTTTSTTSAPAAALPSARPATSTGFVEADGTNLSLDGRTYQPVGLDVYELATDWGQNMGCGGMFSDAELDQLFSSLPPRALVRMWAWQGSMATSPSGQRNWGPLDRVVAAAERHGIELVMSLGSQHGNCDDGRWKDVAWYQGGYLAVGPGDGYARVTTSYWDYVQEIVSRYRTSPAVAMWEPINEPEASECDPGYSVARCYGHLTCPSEAAAEGALRGFFDEVGGLIRSIDPNHLIESGAIGGPQCGWVGADSALIDASPGIDVASYHQDTGSAAVSSDLDLPLAAARSVGKPLLAGELGVDGGNGGSCPPTRDRATAVASATDAMTSAGVAGVMLWNYEVTPPSGCGLGIGADDPVLGALRGASG